MINLKKLYLSETEASTRYGYSRQWFQRERWKGTGPKFIKINSGKILCKRSTNLSITHNYLHG